jgi:alkylation response protein AidB-like acyl-CoA dehydrogenase
MNFDLGPDERALQEAIRDLCGRRFPMDRVRALEATGGVDRAAWKDLAQAGVFSLRLPESEGGVGLGMTEAVLVFQELGRALIPGPLISSHLAAGLIDGVATGDRIAGLGGRSGELLLIPYLEALDDVVVLDHKGVWRIDPASLDAALMTRPLDPLSPAHIVEEIPQGDRLARHPVAARWQLEGNALSAAQLAGIASAVTDLSVVYAKERRQFDRPIGSFQAVKHILADMLVRAEVARAAVDAAGVALDGRAEGDPKRAVASAKLLASEAAVMNGKAAVQVHGGMGFTWEVDVHLYLKRAAGLAAAFSQPDELAEAVAASL